VSRRGALALGLGAAVVLLVPWLGAAPLDDPGEGQHAEIAREAWLGRDILTLRLNGVRYFDKPPLLYALGAAALAVFGPVEWAARLPPLLGALLALAATIVLGARLLGAPAGLAAGLALLGSPLFFAFGSYLRPETLFVAAVQWGLTGLCLAVVGADEGTGARRWALAGWIALGLAALAKDPVALVGPPAAVGLALALSARGPASRAGWMPAGAVAAGLALGLGWYVAAALANPGFAWYVLVDNHLLNALGARRFPDADVPLSTGEFLTVSALGVFPWILPAAVGAGRLLREGAWRDPREAPWLALLVWAGGLLALFGLSRFKLPHYALPAYPAIALLAVREWRRRVRSPGWLADVHAAAFAALGLGAGLAAALDGRALLAVVLRATDVQTRKEALTEPLLDWGDVRPLLVHVAVVAGVAALALLIGRRRGGRHALVVVLLATLALTPAVGAGLARVAAARSVAAMGATVAREAPGAVLVHEGPIEGAGALEWYSGRRPVLLDATRSVLAFGATYPEAADTFWDEGRFLAEWRAGRPLLLLTARAPDASVVARIPEGHRRLVAAAHGRRLYRIGCDGPSACGSVGR